MNNRLRLAARIALGVVVACLVVFLAFGIFRLMQAAPSRATAQRLSIALVVSGALGSAAAVAATVLALMQARSPGRQLLDLLRPKLMKHDRLINRTPEMHDLVARIDMFDVVNCHGTRGAGKSFMLEHLTDVVNGHRPPELGHPKPRNVSVTLYFDLADAAGFDEVRAQICRAALGNADATWDDFVASVAHTFKRRRVLLILDNVNSPGLWRALGKDTYGYFASRPDDKLVLGSIDPVMLSNRHVEHVEVSGLDLEASKELVAARGVTMSCNQLVELHDGCNGLPLYMRLLTAYGDKAQSGRGVAAVDEQLIPELPAGARQVLSHASLIALIARQISFSELEDCPLAHLADELATIESRTLMTSIPEHEGRRFKIHDVVRDSALRVLDPEVSQAALFLFKRAHERGELEHAALYAMFADPQAIGTERLGELLEQVIRTAVKSRNYALLGSLHARAHEHTGILHFLSAHQARADLFHYARASELAGLGQYTEAEEELLLSSVVRSRWDRATDGTAQQADLRFLQADIAHLRNQYNEAAPMFEELGRWAAGAGQPALQALCVWGHGHVLRHQGRDLQRALELFDEAAHLADAVGELFPKAYSVTGATGIKVLLGAVSDDEERLLSEIEDEIAATSTHDGYMLEVWKSQAQVAWLRDRRQSAVDIVDAAIERALALNDRLLYNLYFERAEFARFRGDHAASLEDYRRVLTFGNGNDDRNLVTNALLGLVLLELSAGQWLHHGTPEEARASVLSARQIASDADIQLTAETAETVAVMLDHTAPAPQSIRLILL